MAARPRAPSLTDSLKDMPAEPGTDATRKAFAQPVPPKLVKYVVQTSIGPEDFSAHRMLVTECGALAFQDDGQTWLIIAPGQWKRVTRLGVDE